LSNEPEKPVGLGQGGGRLIEDEHPRIAGEASSDFELAVPPTLPIVIFRIKSDRLSPQQRASAHSAIVEEVTRDGRRWISETIVKGQSVLRMMVISYLTEERHLQKLETALTNAVHGLTLGTPNKA